MADQAILQDWGNRAISLGRLSPSLEYPRYHPRWERQA